MNANPEDLTAFSQPEWNDSNHLPDALGAVLSASNEESSQDAYHRLLYAIGNDHAGTYCSAALGILPALENILRDGGPWSQRAVLEVLIELCGTFKPEPGQEVYRGAPLEAAIKQRISAFEPTVVTLASGDSVVAPSARDLLQLIRLPGH